MYTLLLVLIYIAFISLGLPDSLLGSAWPVMQTEFKVPISSVGMISMIISAGTICSSLLSDRVTKKFGTSVVTTVSVFLTAFALFGFSISNSFWMLCLWGIPYGLGAGAIDAALNNYVALHYTSRHMSWLHCFWGVGTIISPYLMSYSLKSSGWQSGYRLVSILQLCIAILLLVTLPVWKINKGVSEDEENQVPLGLRNALKIKGVLQLLLGFFAYCSAEATVMLWASSYLVNSRGVEKTKAAALASLFFIGITSGRFIAGFVSNRLGDHKLIRIGTGVIICGILLILLPIETDFAAFAGFAVIGFGCAPIYPSIIHSTPANFGAENSQAIIGMQMASAYTGTTLMPPLFGLIAKYLTIRLLPFYVCMFVLLMYCMVERTFKTVQ